MMFGPEPSVRSTNPLELGDTAPAALADPVTVGETGRESELRTHCFDELRVHEILMSVMGTASTVSRCQPVEHHSRWKVLWGRQHAATHG